MMRVLVAYGSKHGSTEAVARAVASTLGRTGNPVEVHSAETVDDVDGYDAVVLGGALYMGRLHRAARRFLELHREALARLPLAVFALGQQSPEHEPESRAQLQHALDRAKVAPDTIAIFGGVIDPEQLHFPFNHMPETDGRDWKAIEEWALAFAATVDAQEPLRV